jgi:hypothetical protein
MQMVTDWSAKSWSERQRFDFLLRLRVLDPADAG